MIALSDGGAVLEDVMVDDMSLQVCVEVRYSGN